MILFTLACIEHRLSESIASQTLNRATRSCVDYCFPSQLEEMLVLESALARTPEKWMPGASSRRTHGTSGKT